MAVRHDRPGIPKRDYQTAGCAQSDSIIKADGTLAKDGGVVSQRFYLADAAFLVGLGSESLALFQKINDALLNPVWPLSLGRKSYVPSEPVWIADGLNDEPVLDVLARWPWISCKRKWEDFPEQLLLSWESTDGSGSLKMDQPISSFGERKFGSRFTRSEYIPFPKEASIVPA
jgi:CRISPR system Cascade subunit CasD